jgi:hypothetical protein
MFDTDADGFEYLYFQDGKFEIQYVFNQKDYCISYNIIFPKAGFKPMIEGLDRSFERVADNKWKEYDGMQFFIWSYRLKDDNCIITVQSKIATDLEEKKK